MFPHVTGDPSVVDAFYREDRRLAIITCAGGNRNAMTSGAFIAIRRRRLAHKPAAFVGVSSGIATNAYLMGNGKATDARVFSHDMTDARMFTLRRLIANKYPFDVDYVERVFRGIETCRGIDAARVLTHGSPLYAVLADAESGEAKIFRPETTEEVWQLASYGAAVTGFARPINFKGLHVTDGFFSHEHLPVQWIIEQEKPTDILVFAGTHYMPSPKQSSRVEQALYGSGLLTATKSVRELLKTRHIRFMKAANGAVTRPDVRVCIVWIPKKLSPLYINKHKSRELIKVGYETIEGLFKQRRW